MKKKLLGFVAVVGLTMACLTGCGASQVKTIDTAALADDLYGGVTWNDQLGEIELNKALTLYGIGSDSVASGKVYMGTNATAEEVAVLEAASADQVAAIEDGIEARIDAQLASFQSYNAEEVPKLESAYVETKGNYVIFCVCDDASEAQSIVDACFTE